MASPDVFTASVMMPMASCDGVCGWWELTQGSCMRGQLRWSSMRETKTRPGRTVHLIYDKQTRTGAVASCHHICDVIITAITKHVIIVEHDDDDGE